MSNDNFDLSDFGSALPAAAAALSEEDRAGLVNALKDKLQSLAAGQSDILETLSPKVRKRVEFLRGIQSQRDELEAKFFEERAALEAKYQKLYEPLYTKRNEIVNGVVGVGVVKETAVDQEGDKDYEEKGVPDFWLTAMKTNEALAEEIKERDEGALKYLKDIKWCRSIDNPKDFKLEFFFDTNPYFKNSFLTKTYHMIDDDEPILEKAIGTEIEWYPGKSLRQKILKKKPRKGSKNAKPTTKTENLKVSLTSLIHHKFPRMMMIWMKILPKSFKIKWSRITTLDQQSGTKLSLMRCHGLRGSWLYKGMSLAVQGDDQFEDIGDDDNGHDDDEGDGEYEDDDDDDEEEEGKGRKQSSAGPKER